MIRWFKNITDEDFSLTGGKGFNLSKMYNSKINIPNGFIITSKVYDEYVEKNNLKEVLEDILYSSENADVKSSKLKELFKVDLLDSILVDEIYDNFREITSQRVAVRSSSVMEDLPDMSFAGQYDSFLNITKENLLESIIDCWKSIWNVRAIEYREKYSIDNDITIAVIIQEMVESKVSGVVFTSNPITGVRNEMLINSAYGLGEGIVGGDVHPDEYIVNKLNKAVISSVISNKERQYVYSNTGIELVAVKEEYKGVSSLSKEQLEKLVETVKNVEVFFDKPQDIEFAINEEIYILQSRDITTLFPIDNLDFDDKLRAYMCANTVLLGMKEPFTPFGYDIFSTMFPTIINIMTAKKKPIDDSFVKYVAGRIYIDITYLMSKKFIAKKFGSGLSGNDLPLEGVINYLIDNHGHRFTHQGIKFKIPWGVVKYSVSMIGDLKRVNKIPYENRNAAMQSDGDKLYKKYVKKLESLKSREEKMDFAQEALVEAFKLSQKQSLYCVAMNTKPSLDKKIKKLFGSEFDLTILEKSFPDCITLELGVRLNELAKHYYENNIEPTKNDVKIVGLLDRFGHRSTIELDFGVKRWSEDPEYLINMIKSYMVDQMYIRNLKEVEDNRTLAELETEKIYNAYVLKKGRRKADKIKKQIEDYRYAAGMREYPKFDIVRMLDLARKAVLQIGGELLKNKEDIFYISKQDILNNVDLEEIAAKNKAEYVKELARTSIPRIVMNNGETIYTAQTHDKNSSMIQGHPLSAGTCEGRVRIVLDPKHSELLEGEILVTESTNPAWTPLFATAKGLIIQYGGPLSHGGIVAREYGIPAVVGVENIFENGQLVKIDGEAGTVELIDEKIL